jgi:hypothetical protein
LIEFQTPTGQADADGFSQPRRILSNSAPKDHGVWADCGKAQEGIALRNDRAMDINDLCVEGDNFSPLERK